MRNILEIKVWPFGVTCLWVQLCNNVHDQNVLAVCNPQAGGLTSLEIALAAACIGVELPSVFSSSCLSTP